eukprot:COSAG06_NODE_63134_length_263_cov_0.628049_1_plen_36_part_01
MDWLQSFRESGAASTGSTGSKEDEPQPTIAAGASPR